MEALRRANSLRATAAAGEPQLIDRWVQIVRDIDAVRRLPVGEEAAPLRRRSFSGYFSLVRDTATAYPADSALQANLARALYSAPAIAEFLGTDPAAVDAPALRSEGKTLLSRQFSEHPERSESQMGRALICVEEKEDVIECMRFYKRCHELEPTESRCSLRLKGLRTTYTRGSCSPPNIRTSFTFYLGAYEKKAPFEKASTYNGVALYEQSGAILTAKDFEVEWAEDDVDGHAQRLFTITLGVSAQKRVEDLATRWREREPRLVFHDGPTVLGSVSLRTGDVASIKADLGVSPESLCSVVDPRQLPSDLRVP